MTTSGKTEVNGVEELLREYKEHVYESVREDDTIPVTALVEFQDVEGNSEEEVFITYDVLEGEYDILYMGEEVSLSDVSGGISPAETSLGTPILS